VKKARLFFATNKVIPEKALVRKIAEANESNIDEVIDLIKSIIDDPPEGVKEKAEYVLSREELLRQIIPIINLSDGNSPQNIDENVISLLHLTDSIAVDVLYQLKGWIHSSIVECWNNGQPGLISRDSFDAFLNQARFRASTYEIRERVKRLVLLDVDTEKRIASQQGIFVKQLEAISDDQDLILEAIDDFLCADEERTRLILAGEITGTDFEDFDQKCEDRWNTVKRRKIRSDTLSKIINDDTLSETEKSKRLKELGFDIYDQTVCSDYRGILAGYTTTEPYLTKGTYYIISDDLRLGWHPKWQELFKLIHSE